MKADIDRAKQLGIEAIESKQVPKHQVRLYGLCLSPMASCAPVRYNICQLDNNK